MKNPLTIAGEIIKEKGNEQNSARQNRLSNEFALLYKVMQLKNDLPLFLFLSIFRKFYVHPCISVVQLSTGNHKNPALWRGNHNAT